MNVSIIVPAYNAADTLPAVLAELQGVLREKSEIQAEVIVVNDGSTDATARVLESYEAQGVQVIHHPRNRGYGAALKTGIRHASHEIVVTLDADCQHDPSFIPKLLEALMGGADLASGARQGLFHSPPWRMPGKWFIRELVSFLSGQRIPDFNCGFRAFKKSVAQKYLHLCPDGYSLSTTILLAFLNRGYEVVFITMATRRRQGSERSRVTLRTGFETILLVLRLMTLFNPLRVFLPASFLCVALGLGWGTRYLVLGLGLSTGALLFLFTGAIIFFVGLVADQIAELRKERYE